MFIPTDIKGKLGKLYMLCRENDHYFKDLRLEERSLLNDLGKILGILSSTLICYEAKNEDYKLKVRQHIHKIKCMIEEMDKNFLEEEK